MVQNVWPYTINQYRNFTLVPNIAILFPIDSSHCVRPGSLWGFSNLWLIVLLQPSRQLSEWPLVKMSWIKTYFSPKSIYPICILRLYYHLPMRSFSKCWLAALAKDYLSTYVLLWECFQYFYDFWNQFICNRFVCVCELLKT